MSSSAGTSGKRASPATRQVAQSLTLNGHPFSIAVSREIGIRMALGADSSAVLRLVLRQGLVLAAIGVGIGVAAGAVAPRLLESLLFGISALDPAAFAGAIGLFLVVTLAASYIPARRATKMDPVAALRAE